LPPAARRRLLPLMRQLTFRRHYDVMIFFDDGFPHRAATPMSTS